MPPQLKAPESLEAFLARIDQALERMRSRGHGDSEHYENLKRKRQSVAEGNPYQVVNVAPFLIAYMGSHIPECNFGAGGRTIKPRGNREKATIQVVKEFENNKKSDLYVPEEGQIEFQFGA